jgi:hypothetical protein
MGVMIAVKVMPVGRTAAARHQVTDKTTISIRTRTESPTPRSTATTTTRTPTPTRSRTLKRVESAHYGVLTLALGVVDVAVDMREEVWMIARQAWGKTKGHTWMRGTQAIMFRMDSCNPQKLGSD